MPSTLPWEHPAHFERLGVGLYSTAFGNPRASFPAIKKWKEFPTVIDITTLRHIAITRALPALVVPWRLDSLANFSPE
jgi:hypothetical protein